MDKLKCLIDGCSVKPYSRGVCHPHYSMMLKAVTAKTRTWEEFEDIGMCLPKKVRKSESRKQFEKALTKNESKPPKRKL